MAESTASGCSKRLPNESALRSAHIRRRGTNGGSFYYIRKACVIAGRKKSIHLYVSDRWSRRGAEGRDGARCDQLDRHVHAARISMLYLAGACWWLIGEIYRWWRRCWRGWVSLRAGARLGLTPKNLHLRRLRHPTMRRLSSECSSCDGCVAMPEIDLL